MILELEPVTPFIIKTGTKFSILDLYEDNGELIRIDTERFVKNLKKEELETLKNLLDEFIELKNNSNKKKDGRIIEKYAEEWKKINSFNIKNGAEKYKILPKMSTDQTFKRYFDFDDFISIEIRGKNGKELIPYIPGSTIKGMVRRMLMLEYISKKNKEWFDLNFRSEDLKEMERTLKGVMPLIQISDFYPAGKVEIKLSEVKRSAPNALPLIYSGKFYGELNIQSKLRDRESSLRQFGIEGNTQQMEESLLGIVLKNSNMIIKKNREWYKDTIYFGPENSNDLIALGYGKGLTLSGFAAVRNELKLILPDIRSKTGFGNERTEQKFPKTHWTVKCFNGEKFMDTKLGILRVRKNNEYDHLKEIKEIVKEDIQ